MVGLIFLALLHFLIRLWPITGNSFTFMFDHAKDQLAIMDMGITQRPVLIGAITSIPGVFNGPLWYYLALPLNILLHYQPLASVLTIIILTALVIGMMYRFAGVLPALLLTTSVGMVGAAQSAWIPYMTPLVTTLILLVLLKPSALGIRRRWIAPVAMLLTGLTFHFQTAFGVVLTPLVVFILIRLKHLKLNRRLMLALLAFLLPFIPFFIFELRHDFHQIKQIGVFLEHFQERSRGVEPNAAGVGRLVEIAQYMLTIAARALLPFRLPPMIEWLTGLLLSILCGRFLVNRAIADEKVVYLVLLLGTYGFYLFLPAKAYYFIGLLPVWCWLIARSVAHMSFRWRSSLAVGLIVGAMITAWQGRSNYAHLTLTEAFPLAPKLAAVERVYELSLGNTFDSYHFVNEIYDYTYQFIYRYNILRGYPVPREYSYAPGETRYMHNTLPPAESPAETVFLIVEKPLSAEVFENWWHRVTDGLEIEEEIVINQAIRVYTAKRV